MAYRKEHGRLARMTAFWTLAIVMLYGCVRLKQTLAVTFPESLGRSLGADAAGEGGLHIPILGLDVSIALLIAGGLAILGLTLLYRFLEKPRRADLLIETEQELRKVSWPTLDEAVDGSIVVVVVVVFLMGFMAAADYVLGVIFQRIITGGGGGA